ncbi:DNA mismatch repair protein MutT [Pedobacter sp. PACM 27299]|uniref:metallophosphoesterase n=1 Tax=Pedobacter sp. PACM 27299 TaxID=1727164 RepID=UPI0007058D80|nr:metallophosphoesterase [Pedobacter sp. PACM 27299]ALL08353.1 DNA mismatch repair protein MutT [Pedobacter sp. PACM 27299]
MGRLPVFIFLSVLLLAFDYYCFRAILSVFKKWKPGTRKLFTILWWGYTFVLLVGVFSTFYANLFLSLKSVILVAYFLTVACKLVLLPFLVIDDFRRFIIKLSRSSKPNTGPVADPVLPETMTQVTPGEPISRSSFLVKAGLVTAAIPLTSLSWGIARGAYDYKVIRKTLVLPNLPSSFEGMKLGQISDIHSGSFYNPRAVLGGVEMLLTEKPDVIFFTGDLVNDLATEMRDYQDIFKKVKAPLGVYSVLGNHDYGEYRFGKEPSAIKTKNLQEVIKTHGRMGWDLLMNQHRRLKVNGEEIGILGIENWGTGRFPKYGRMDLATKDTDDLPVKLLLSHDPSHWRAEVLPKYPQIDAMFSGHTHGMQFGVRTEDFQWSPVQYIYNEWAGLYQEKQQQLYVNVGYGFLGYPGRVGILPEITIFELKRA